MKKRFISASLALMITGTSMLSSCYGEFALTRMVYGWNDTLHDNKFVKSFIFYVFTAVQVYSIAFLGDFIVLNLVEFWTGSNPVAMAPGEKETQVIAHEGKKFEVTATQNQFAVTSLEGEKVTTYLRFDPEATVWNHVDADGNETALINFIQGEEGNMLEFILDENQSIILSEDELNREAAEARFELEGC
ncbi:MAG: DUF3332 domain-containing protein [Cryomorphaceae bacterium]|nr:DUF3332 domain-containing protein [Cryomorphaceae bacterium]